MNKSKHQLKDYKKHKQKVCM